MGMTSKEYHKGYQQGYKDSKEEYKTRLNADMVAMLTDIKAEIVNVYACNNEAKFMRMTCRDIIQQKINALLAETEGEKK